MRLAVTLRVLLPVLTYPDEMPTASLPRAADLAATLGAHVTAIVNEVDIPPFNNPVAEFILALEKQSQAAEQLSRSRGHKLAGEIKHLFDRLALPLTLETLRTQRPCGDIIAARAGTYDLTMLLCDPLSPDHALLQQDVLFGSGGPVIIFPTTDAPSHLRTVAVAWDGSRAAARAVRDALPILTKAGSVRLMTCTQDKPVAAASVDGILAHLAAHGVNATHAHVALDDQPVGIALQVTARAQDAGMLVMGAYGHSRMREFVLGGATTSALLRPLLPLFMSH